VTKKIDKKTKLDAMLQMWCVLRGQSERRPFHSASPDHKIMSALQGELAKLLGISSADIRQASSGGENQLIILLSELRGDLEGHLSTLRSGNAYPSIVEDCIRKINDQLTKCAMEAFDWERKNAGAPESVDTPEKLKVWIEAQKKSATE